MNVNQVEVISGNHRGSTGKVLSVLARKQRVLIEGVRMIKKHLRKSQDQPQGSIAEREGPIHISNVKVVERGERKGKTKASGKGKMVLAYDSIETGHGSYAIDTVGAPIEGA